MTDKWIVLAWSTARGSSSVTITTTITTAVTVAVVLVAED